LQTALDNAAKGQYPVFLENSLRLLAPNGIIIADNIFFNGYVAEGKPDRHRNKTIVTRLDEFITRLEAEQSLKTVLLPISDGVSLSYKI
jgi:caffeoyl-CoA O-methyltransferase